MNVESRLRLRMVDSNFEKSNLFFLILLLECSKLLGVTKFSVGEDNAKI
jgi:hypothetical protein